MTNYQNCIMMLLQGNTPKEKFDFLTSLVSDMYITKQLLDVSFSEKDMLEFANGMRESVSREITKDDLMTYKYKKEVIIEFNTGDDLKPNG